MNAPRFGLAIRVLRVRSGWRQEDLGSAAGVSRSLVSRVERGRLRGVPVDALDRLATALDARLDLQVRWEGEGLDRLLDEATPGSSRWWSGCSPRSGGRLRWRCRSRTTGSAARSTCSRGTRAAGACS